jgi:hypothetical protein
MGISEFSVFVCFDLLWTMDTYGTWLRTWTIFLLFFLIFPYFSSHFTPWKQLFTYFPGIFRRIFHFWITWRSRDMKVTKWSRDFSLVRCTALHSLAQPCTALYSIVQHTLPCCIAGSGTGMAMCHNFLFGSFICSKPFYIHVNRYKQVQTPR